MTHAFFTAAVACGAGLLFSVQPMFARMLLPHLGSSPVVWSTALVFYQAGLLVGYAYAHLATTRLGVRRQAALHLALVAAAGLTLPVALRAGGSDIAIGAPALDFPVPWLAWTMLVSVGAPYVAVASTGPLLQRWLAEVRPSGGGGGGGGRPDADPYALYAVSNAGSLAALLAYPFLVEPSLGLVAQSRLWTVGYVVLWLLLSLCAAVLWRSPALAVADAGAAQRTTASAIAWPARAGWTALAALPSALLVSVTSHISADVAAVPLLWVLPLAVYLSTYALAFSRHGRIITRGAGRALPFTVVLLVVVLGARVTQPAVPLLVLHLLGLFVAAALCHGRLAAARPAPAGLTEFYLWVAFGGVLGGTCAALLAPLLFDTVAEYPLALVLVCLLAYRPSGARLRTGGTALAQDVGLPVLLGALAAGLFSRGADATLTGNPLAAALLFGPPAIILLTFLRSPLRFAIGAGALLLASLLFYGGRDGTLLQERSFFGVHRVRRVRLGPEATFHVLVHGSTLHGVQRQEPGRREEPLAYYVRSGPVGQVFAALDIAGAGRPVGVVGLGTGGLACYGSQRQPWTFFEIDPVVERIARDPRYFTFLRDCPPASAVVLGDGRLALAATPDAHFGTLILDAYSSDAIPVHLLTREALRLYLQKLAPDGVLVFHLSSRHLDLAPVLGALAADAGLVARVGTESAAPGADASTPSRWAVVARRPADLGPLTGDPRWPPAPDAGAAGLWTDDYASVVRAFRWL